MMIGFQQGQNVNQSSTEIPHKAVVTWESKQKDNLKNATMMSDT